MSTKPLPAKTSRRRTVTRPSPSLARLGSGQSARLLAAASDLTLVLDSDGTVSDMAFGNEALARELGTAWVGQRWLDLVALDSRPKVQAQLSDPAPAGAPRWRPINLLAPDGSALLLDCAALQVPADDEQPACTLVLARDQRLTAALQQRLIEAQMAVERDYARFRQAELRYRHLFQLAAEAMLLVDASTGKVTEANPAAAELLGLSTERLAGPVFPVGLAARHTAALQALLGQARRSGRADAVNAQLAGGRQTVQVSASLFHQEPTSLLLVRLVPGNGGTLMGGGTAGTDAAWLLQLARQAPDALVLTDPQGEVLACNAEFVRLSQTAGPDQVRGQSLDRWLGRSGVDLGVLLSNLRQGGTVKLFATTLRDAFGGSTEVEISAVTVGAPDAPAFGFAVRDVGRRLSPEPAGVRGLPSSVNQLTELVGRVPMKDIVSETSDLIEKLCIEAALELTRDNRASAAEILGLSRQSLYVKLRRYGLGDLGGERG